MLKQMVQRTLKRLRNLRQTAVSPAEKCPLEHLKPSYSETRNITAPVSSNALKEMNARMGALQWVFQDYSFETMPQWISFSTTYRCNLRCRHCQTHGTEELARKFNREVWPEELADSLAEQLLPLAREYCLSLNGEPLLTPRLVTRLMNWRTYGARLHLTTNATLLTDRFIEAIVPHANQIHISVDAGTPYVYEAIRAGARFPRLLHNLRLLTRTLESLGDYRKPALALSVTLMGSNIKELPWLVDLAHFVNIPTVLCYPLTIYFPHVRGEEVSRHKILYNQYSEQARRKARQLGVRLENLPPLFAQSDTEDAHKTAPTNMIAGILSDEYYSNVPPLASLVDDSEISRRAENIAYRIKTKSSELPGSERDPVPGESQDVAEIISSWNSAATNCGQIVKDLPPDDDTLCGYCETLHKCSFINHGGDVTPCCVTPHRPILGNIHRGTFRAIWNGPTHREFRKKVWSADPPDCCKGCRNLQRLTRGELATRLGIE